MAGARELSTHFLQRALAPVSEQPGSTTNTHALRGAHEVAAEVVDTQQDACTRT
ncbi:hypothetical protein VDGD_20115 [Verticillium dahliae]|nr:hypothetical protein VDGD_20115 [Verticillium dahliae]